MLTRSEFCSRPFDLAHRPLFGVVIDAVLAHVAVDLHRRGGARRVDGVHAAQARPGPVDVVAVGGQQGRPNRRRQQDGERKPELEPDREAVR